MYVAVLPLNSLILSTFNLRLSRCHSAVVSFVFISMYEIAHPRQRMTDIAVSVVRGCFSNTLFAAFPPHTAHETIPTGIHQHKVIKPRRNANKPRFTILPYSAGLCIIFMSIISFRSTSPRRKSFRLGLPLCT